MNKVILVGRLVGDAVVFGGGRVVKIRLATRIGYDERGRKELIAFVPVTLLLAGKAQIDSLRKGIMVGVEGIVAETSFKKNNETVFATDVQVRKGGLRFM